MAQDGQPRRLARIGEGAHGEVWLAEVTNAAGLTRRVALKVLAEGHADNEEAARRMRDEARLLGRLAHPNVVAVHDLVALPDGRTAMVMDLVPGADLSEILDEAGAVPVRAALAIGAAVLRALDAAWHADDGAGGKLQVVHRDIKPANVRITPDGDVKVLDFGVARFAPALREARTSRTQWMGTERYMAPERIALEGDTPAGDVYAAAATVVELLLGEPLGRSPVLAERHGPFVELALERIGRRLAVGDERVRPLLDLLRAALHADPAARPPAAVVADGLEALAPSFPGESLPQFARRVVSALDRLEVSSVPAVATEVPTAPLPERSGWRAPLAVALALVLVGITAGGVLTGGGVLAALGILVAGGPDDPPLPAPVAIELPPARPIEVPMPEPPAGPLAPSPIPAPTPAVATPPPVVAEVVAPVPVPEPAPVEPIATAPEPPPAPAPPVLADLSGRWTGRAGGRPFELRLAAQGSAVSGQATFPNVTAPRVETLAGTFDGATLDLRSTDGRCVFSGAFADGTLAGTYRLEGRRPIEWSARREGLP